MGRRFTYYNSSYASLVCTAEGLAFIAAHEAATGLPMGLTQKQAVCGFVSRLMGVGTTNSSDLWTLFLAKGTLIHPLTPVNNTTANASAYSMELMSASSIGIYVNFVSGDFTPTGVIGGSTKYFDSSKTPNNFSLNSQLHGAYINSGATVSAIQYVFGSIGSSNTMLQFRTGSPSTAYATQNSNSFHSSGLDFNSLWFSGRNNSTQQFYQVDLVTPETEGKTSAAQSTAYNIYFHGANSSGTLSLPASDLSLAMYFLNMPSNLNAAQRTDLLEAVQWYQTNVITGGRNV